MIVVAGEALVDILVGADGALSAIPGGGPFNTCQRQGADPPRRDELRRPSDAPGIR